MEINTEYMGFKLSYTGSRYVSGFRKYKCNNVLPDFGEYFFLTMNNSCLKNKAGQCVNRSAINCRACMCTYFFHCQTNFQ
jgi:hypothetical protein